MARLLRFAENVEFWKVMLERIWKVEAKTHEKTKMLKKTKRTVLKWKENGIFVS